MKKKAWLLSIVAALVLGFGGWIFSGSGGQQQEVVASQPVRNTSFPVITGYSQDAKTLTVELEAPDKSARYVMLPDVPAKLEVGHLRQQSKEIGIVDKKIVVLLDSEPDGGEYSIVFFLEGGFFELVRQSPGWWRKTFNFDRAGGYTILGRRSVETEHAGSKIEPLVFKENPAQLNYSPANVSAYQELNDAAGLLRKLWSSPIQQGPTSQSYATFLDQSFEEKMRRVGSGEFAVMCQGFRDLFLHASAADKHFRVRPVEAYNYFPQIPDLITYGHSTTEIWVEALKKWILFDPWLGIMVYKNGVPVGAQELSEMTQTEGLTVIPLLEKMPRLLTGSDGKVIHNSFKPTDVQLDSFSCQELGCSPGYIEYFKSYRVREFRILE